MKKGVYIWLNYKKATGSCNSKLDFAGTVDVQKAITAINKITKEDLLKRQSSKFFSHDVECSISMQDITTGENLYRRTLE